MAISSAKGRWPLLLAAALAFVLILGTFHGTKHRLPDGTHKFWPFHDATASEQPQAAYEPFVHGQIVGSGQLESDTPFEIGSGLALGEAQQDEIVGGQVQTGPPFKQKEFTFFELATKHGSDKVTEHSYQDMYEHHLSAMRHKPVKMLQIGLGCDLTSGPGASYGLWLEYFSNVDLYFVDYDAACIAEWAHLTTKATIISAEQGDVTVLDKLLEDYGSDFDIIIDDGGHMTTHQQASLEYLWKAVKPGGMYFCEDLQVSYLDDYGGGATAVNTGTITMVQYIQLMIEDLIWGPQRVTFSQSDQIMHIDCSREVCGFFKRKLPTLNL